MILAPRYLPRLAATIGLFTRYGLKDFATLSTGGKLPNDRFGRRAAEKLAKAHLCAGGTDPGALQTSHAYIAKTLPVVIRQQIAFAGSGIKNPQWVYEHAKHLAHEIELLAPAVKRGGDRPDNCEYPWQDDNGALHLPLDWTFTPSRLLLAPAGVTFLKLVRHAIDRANRWNPGVQFVRRPMLIDRVEYRDGWPSVEGGTPSTVARAAPRWLRSAGA